jgi:hypothetical protein
MARTRSSWWSSRRTQKDGQPVIDDKTGEVRRRLRIQFVNRAGGLAMKSALSPTRRRSSPRR